MDEPTEDYVRQNKDQSTKLLAWCDQMETALKEKLQHTDLPDAEREKAHSLLERVAQDRESAQRRIAELDRFANDQ